MEETLTPQSSPQSTPPSENKLSVPLAIIVAGALIAGAIYLSKGPVTAAPAGQNGKTAQTEPGKIDIRPIDAKDHFIGNPQAPVTFVEYSDLECPFCKRFHETALSLIEEFGKKGQVAWVYRHFPLAQLHPKAPKEAEAVECVNELSNGTATWNYINKIFEVTPANNGLEASQLPELAAKFGVDRAKFNECLSSGRMKLVVDADMQDAIKAGGRGTPFVVIVMKNKITDGKKAQLIALFESLGPGGSDYLNIDPAGLQASISGALPADFMREFIKKLLE